MSTTLYEQAIIDAKSLKLMAEENARNHVIEAITPQLRALIESEMLQEDSRYSVLDEMIGGDEDDDTEDTDDSDQDDDDGEKLLKGGESKDDDKEEIDEAELKAMALLVNSAVGVHTREIAQRAHQLRKDLAKFVVVKESFDFNDLDQESRMEFLKRFNDLMREGVILRRETILMNEAESPQIHDLVEKTIKEMKTMSRSLNKTILSRLFEEAEGDEELLGLPVEDEGGEDLDMGMEGAAASVEIPDDLARDLLAALEIELGDGEGEELDMEMPSEEGGEEELDLEVDMYEADDSEKEELDEVFEIDVNELRRELRKLQEGEAADMADQFGGGEALGDVVFEIDEDDLINVLADELGREDVPMPKMESRRRRSGGMNESRAQRKTLQESREIRALKSRLTESLDSNSKLRGQLSEMNLFNAKVLYANKLMQNTGLSSKQQKAIVEALDGAKTLEEAKLLYKSLTAALDKRKSLSESKKLGSASKSTRPSGQPLNEGVGATDRWAVLAGIDKNQD